MPLPPTFLLLFSRNYFSWSSWIPRLSTGTCHNAVHLGPSKGPSTQDPPPMSQEAHTKSPPPPHRPRYIWHRGRHDRPSENSPAPSPAEVCGKSCRRHSTSRSQTRSGRTICHSRHRGHRTSGLSRIIGESVESGWPGSEPWPAPIPGREATRKGPRQLASY